MAEREQQIQRSLNHRLENSNIFGSKKDQRKRYRRIVQEMGARNITLRDLASSEALAQKEPGILDMMRDTEMTMDELVVLQQYSQAIVNQSTKAAEFLRNTAGDAPSTQVELTDNRDNGLSQMSLEELEELRDLLKQQQKIDEVE